MYVSIGCNLFTRLFIVDDSLSFYILDIFHLVIYSKLCDAVTDRKASLYMQMISEVMQCRYQHGAGIGTHSFSHADKVSQSLIDFLRQSATVMGAQFLLTAKR